ncbi:unnamed protein product [Didymodactylos carnosus]|uniref:Uncharacterized protein n=1 Tax=Didymodactylos carnosus TaxID=1234261 RepID=A0A815FQ27_9BILA|nr:unnamed protein product [Didymodactylos carnosus]CAF4183408.1 unnamed protein product [Didymodactylos carnosus]
MCLRLKNVIVNVVSQSSLKLDINQTEAAHQIDKPKLNRTVIACFYSHKHSYNLLAANRKLTEQTTDVKPNMIHTCLKSSPAQIDIRLALAVKQ